MGQYFFGTTPKVTTCSQNCPLYTTYNHCCLLSCFYQIKGIEKLQYVQNIAWYFSDKHEIELLKFLTKLKLNDTIQIIISYLQSTTLLTNVNNKNYSALVHTALTPINYKYDGVCKYFLKYAIQQNKQNKSNNSIKVVMLGCGGVGKSSLTIRLLTDNFLDEYDPTIMDEYRKLIQLNVSRNDIDSNMNTITNQLPNPQSIVLDILDTAGREEFSSIIDMWLRNGQIFLLVFDVMQQVTFEEIKLVRERILRTKDSDFDGKHGEMDYVMIAVGNKCDLRYDPTYKPYRGRIPVDIQEMNKWLKECKMPYIETSAKTSQNVNFLFRQAVYEYWITTQTD